MAHLSVLYTAYLSHGDYELVLRCSATFEARQHHIMGSNRMLGLFQDTLIMDCTRPAPLFHLATAYTGHSSFFGIKSFSPSETAFKIWALRRTTCRGDYFGALHSAPTYLVRPETSPWPSIGSYA